MGGLNHSRPKGLVGLDRSSRQAGGSHGISTRVALFGASPATTPRTRPAPDPAIEQIEHPAVGEWTDAMRDESTREKRPSRRRWMKWEDSLRRYATQAGLQQWARAAGNRSERASRAEFSERFIEG